MTKHPAEVFGYPLGSVSSLPKKGHRKYWCPFADNKCNKQSRLIRYPMGVTYKVSHGCVLCAIW
jgi:hypothetical protein